MDEPRIAGHLRLGHQQGAQFRFVEPGYACPPVFVQLPTTARTSYREHRHTGGAQRLHVPMHRAFRYLEPSGQIAARQAAVRLQEQKCGKQTIGSHIYKNSGGIMTQADIYDPLGLSLPNFFHM